MFGSISLCAIVFDALAVRLWFVGWRKTGGFIGFVAALAFVVTFSNSLGGIVSRADTVHAQRQSVTDARADNRREVQRLEQALNSASSCQPTRKLWLRPSGLLTRRLRTARPSATSAGRTAGNESWTSRLQRQRYVR